MADIFDIFNPPKTQVVKGVEGKMMLVHSDGVKCGKTTVGSQMPKPYYLRFEQGANAIDGLPYAPLTSWSDFKKVNKMLCDTKEKEVEINGEKKKITPKDLYTTIIIDTFDVAIRWCAKYVCAKYGVERLKDGNNGYGLWQEYADEWFGEMNKLMNTGYFIYGIAHSELKKVVDGTTGEEYEQMCPKGDKRTIDLIIEAVDFIGYVKNNGVDEKGNIIKSSIYFAETSEYKAGSRFDYMPRYIKEFSAENIQEAIKIAVEKKEQETGSKAITFEEKKKKEAKKTWTHKEILQAIEPYVNTLYDEYSEEVMDIIVRNIGEDIKISETTAKQIPQLEVMLFELQELAKDKGIMM